MKEKIKFISGVCIIIIFIAYGFLSNKESNISDTFTKVFEEDDEFVRGQIKYLSLEEDPFADDAKTVETALQKWNFVSHDSKKIAYLTFDDGPSSKVTGEVLSVLKENDVKATFFILGSVLDKSDDAKETLKLIVQDGHAIGNHGYCHKYEKLYYGSYVNVPAFIEDINKSLNSMQAVLGNGFHTRIIRFPGGHNTWKTSEIDKYLRENNYIFIDWNVVNGDAFASVLSSDELFTIFKKTFKKIDKNNDKIILLMHDTDKNINEAKFLEEAIIYLKDLGYEFRSLK